MTSNHACFIGLMSGTSLDGVDAALITTDGESITALGHAITLPYPPQFRQDLAQAMQDYNHIPTVEDALTRYHARAVEMLLDEAGLQAKDVKAIGFHGQTIDHQPERGFTWQIGNGALLAALTGIDVVCDFRRHDVALGGQGAPLVPIFHCALAGYVKDVAGSSVAYVNIGGIANITYVTDSRNPHELWGFDTGPGNKLIDRFVQESSGMAYDKNGDLGLKGRVDEAALHKLMQHEGVISRPPKSFDVTDFDLSPVADLSLEDGAATLAAFTADAIAANARHFDAMPHNWVMCGGGRLNGAIVERLKGHVQSVRMAEDYGLNGDAIEAYAFGYLAARSLRRLPITFPNTTGVSRAATGGAFYPA